MKQRIFKFTISYFKPNGKYYLEEEVMWVVSDCGSEMQEAGFLTPPTAYIPEAVDKLKSLRDSTEANALPGLKGTGWDGPILITCEDAYPCLILPRSWGPTTERQEEPCSVRL
jgi:hypothetical protein